MINFRIGIGFLDGIFHFDHDVPPPLLVKAVQVVAIVQTVPVVQNPSVIPDFAAAVLWV
jgi:hypothetical protein